MTRFIAFAFAALFAFGLASTEAAAGGHGYGCYGAKHSGCARAWRHAGCGYAHRPCKRKMHGFFRKSPPCVAYAPCAAPMYVVRPVPVPVIVDIQPARPAYYARPCGAWRGCGRW